MVFRATLWALLCALNVLGESQTLPRRLVLCLDGVSWRDVNALQEGVIIGEHGRRRAIRAFGFDQGYYKVSRLVSTFPSCSDIAWTEMLGDHPLPGYQRCYFDIPANKVVAQNGITSTLEYESQMHWQEESGWHRAYAYVAPIHEFKREVRLLIHNFLAHSAGIETYYAMLRTTDDAQHMAGNIFGMLEMLDERLEELQALYRLRTGRNLEILILSDHGNNHAGPGKRVSIISFLKHEGYRIRTSIHDSRDVVLPTAGLESWVEIHNAPDETLNLVSRLVHLEGVDLVTAGLPGVTNQFLVCNRKGARALITRDPVHERYCYTMLAGDPLEYAPVVESLCRSQALDRNGFASAEAWMAATLPRRYPVALERIARGLTSVTSNPATIILSLDNRYVHASFLVFRGSRLLTCGGTHGGLDDLNSNGILLSNFAPTSDTTTAKLAGQSGGFTGLNQRDKPGAEIITTMTYEETHNGTRQGPIIGNQ